MNIKHKDYRFWCDDMRTPKSNDWTICRSVESFLTKIKRTPIEVLREKFTLALDNDSGCTKNGEIKPEFYLILNWCEENNIYPKNIYILTSNVYAQQRIIGFVKSAERRNIHINVYGIDSNKFYFNPHI